MNFGYNDTMKAFKRLDGDYFTFRKDEISKFYEKIKMNFSKLLGTSITKSNY